MAIRCSQVLGRTPKAAASLSSGTTPIGIGFLSAQRSRLCIQSATEKRRVRLAPAAEVPPLLLSYSKTSRTRTHRMPTAPYDEGV